MNMFMFMGRLVRDPEIRYYDKPNAKKNEQGVAASFTIAVDRRSKNSEIGADFFNIKCYDKLAEMAEKHLKKGIKIVVQGSIANNNYTDKDGKKVYATSFNAFSIEFCESKTSTSNTGVVADVVGNDTTSQPVDAFAFMNIPSEIGDELPFA